MAPDPNPSTDARLASIAGEQSGAFSLEQAREVGFERHQIRYRIDSGRWLKRLPRAFVLAGAPDCPAQRLQLASLWGGENAVACRMTAAWLWNLANEGPTTDIALPDRRRSPASWVCVHRSALSACDVGFRRGVRTTNPTRTLVDLAREMGEKDLDMMLDAALRSGGTSIPRMRWRLAQLGKGHPGCGVLKDLIDKRLPGGLSESTLETLMGRVLIEMRSRSLPLPERQFVVRLEGRRTARLDFAFPSFKVGLEGDGRRWHGPAQWQEDLRRENAFRQAGWDVRRFSWADITRNPAYILDEAEAALRLAGWRRPVQGTL